MMASFIEIKPKDSSENKQGRSAQSPTKQPQSNPTSGHPVSIWMLRGSQFFSSGSDHLPKFLKVHCYYNGFLIKYCLE